MKILKRIFLSLIILVVLFLATVIALLENEKFLNYAVVTGVKKTNLDIKFEKLQGGIFSGLKIDKLNYENKIKSSLILDIDFLDLLNETIHINQLVVKNLWIDKNFLESLTKSDNNQTKDPSPQKVFSIPFMKRVQIDKILLSIQNIAFENYLLNSLELEIHQVKYLIKNQKAQANIKINLKSNVADLNLTANLNKTQKYKALLALIPHKSFVSKFTNEQNITLFKLPTLKIIANGDMKSIDANISLNSSKIKFREFTVSQKNLNIISNFNLITNDLKANISTLIDSNVANIYLKSDVNLNIDDINSSLNFKTFSKISPNEKYLQQFTKDLNLTIFQMPYINITANGGLKNIKSNVKLSEGEFLFNEFDIKTKTLNIDTATNLISGDVETKLLFLINSNVANLKTLTNLSLNFNNIDESLRYETEIDLRDTNMEGLNLKQFEPINLKANGTKTGIDAKLISPKIIFNAKSDDFKKFQIYLKTKTIDISKILKLPEEVLAKKILLDSEGFYDLSTQNGGLNSDIKINKNFNLKLKAKIDDGKINVNLKNRALKVKATGKIEPLNLQSNIEINSLKSLQKEIKKLYLLESQPIDGKINLSARVQKENIEVALKSKQLIYDKKKIKDILIKSNYKKDRVEIKNFEFRTTGFEQKALNRKFALTKKGVVTLGEKITFDIAFDNMIDIVGYKDENGMLANLKITKFPLELKEYGKLKIDSKIKFEQKEKKSFLRGNLDLYDVDLHYEAKFLNPDSDEDVIIVKKEKSKKKLKDKPKKSDFEKNFFIDLKINSLNPVNYKIDGAEISLVVAMVIEKEFNKGLKVKGKVKKIKGFYDVMGKKFLLEDKSTITFRGLKEINPLLDITLTHKLPDVKIFITVTGDKYRPKIKFTSDPVMDKKNIFSYLTFGTSSDKIGQSSADGNQKKAVAMFMANALTKDIAKSMGVDKIQLGEGADGGLDVKVGKRLNRKTMIIYQNSADKNSIKIQYEINKNWGVDTTTAEDANSIDIFYKKEYR